LKKKIKTQDDKPKSQKKRKIIKKDIKYCPYCSDFYSKNEKKYNFHIAKCFEKNNNEIPQNTLKKRRVTSKPFKYEPLDYKKINYNK